MKLLIFMYLTVFAFAAMASTTVEKQADLDLVKQACKDPASVHNQIPPSDIKIGCSMKVTKWMSSGTPGTFGAPAGSKEVCSLLTTSKPGIHMPKDCVARPAAPPTTFNCPIIAEYFAHVITFYGSTCDEIVNVTDLGVYCDDRLTSDIAADPNVLQFSPTGWVINLCDIVPMPAPTGTGNPGQDPRQCVNGKTPNGKICVTATKPTQK